MEKISQTWDNNYADDTIILAESEQQLQHMIDKLDATWEQYGMAMNAKKIKTMIVEKTPEKQCEVNVKGQRLTRQAIQVKQYKYLGTTGRSKTEVANKPSEDCFLEEGYHSEK